MSHWKEPNPLADRIAEIEKKNRDKTIVFVVAILFFLLCVATLSVYPLHVIFGYILTHWGW